MESTSVDRESLSTDIETSSVDIESMSVELDWPKGLSINTQFQGGKVRVLREFFPDAVRLSG